MKSNAQQLLTVLVVTLFIPQNMALARTWHINAEGTGEAPTIQAGIELAFSGDIVELANGTYLGEGNRDIDFLGKAIEVRSEGGIPENCVIDCQGSPSDPHRAFEFHSNEGQDSRVGGIRIINGYSTNGGGAIYCSNVSPTIENCIFFENQTESKGGAISGIDSSTQIRNCVFEGGLADDGGGINFSNPSNPVVVECLFLNNRADIGGAFGIRSQCSPTIEDCTFSGNIANGSGGAIYCDNATFSILGCTFWGNDGGLFGAGGISGSIPAGATITNTLIAGSPQGMAVGAVVDFTCCNLFGNAGGDWVWGISDQLGNDGNIELDPQFCSTSPEDDRYWVLQSDSPCVPENSGCGLIGAWGPGCGTTESATATWGGVKALYR